MLAEMEATALVRARPLAMRRLPTLRRSRLSLARKRLAQKWRCSWSRGSSAPCGSTSAVAQNKEHSRLGLGCRRGRMAIGPIPLARSSRRGRWAWRHFPPALRECRAWCFTPRQAHRHQPRQLRRASLSVVLRPRQAQLRQRQRQRQRQSQIQRQRRDEAAGKDLAVFLFRSAVA